MIGTVRRPQGSVLTASDLAAPEMRNRAQDARGVEQTVNAAERGRPSRHEKGQKLLAALASLVLPGEGSAVLMQSSNGRPITGSTNDADS